MPTQTSDRSYRDMIKREAEKHLLKVSDAPADLVLGKRKGADFLRTVLANTLEMQPAWTPANLKAIETPGQWLNVNGQGGTTDSQKAVHWCGIFATYVLKQTGMAVKWRSGDGIVPSDANSPWVRKRRRWIAGERFADDDFEIGDVAAIPRANHHFVIVDVSNPATLGCVAGNGNYQRIERQTHGRKDINCLYKIVWDPLASRL